MDEHVKISNLPVPVLILSTTGHVVACNHLVSKFTGCRKNEIVGRHFTKLSFVRSGDLHMFRQIFNLVLKKGFRRPFIARYRKRNGAEGFAEVQVNFMKEKKLLIIVTVEVTDRMHFENSLIVKDAAIESSINAIAIADLSGNLIYVNSSFLKLWGYDSETQVLGKNALDFWCTKKRASQVMQYLLKNKSWVGELEAKKRDGTRFTAQLIADVIKDDMGKPSNLMASFIDVSEKKQAEEALKENEEKLRLLVKSVGIGLLYLDKKGVITELNPEVERLAGLSREEMIGKNIVHLFPQIQFDKNSILKTFSKRMAGKKKGSIEIEVTNAKGRNLFLYAHPTVIKNKGKIVGEAVFIEDITKRKQLAKDLLISKKRAETSEKSKDQLLKSVSHELRTPMNAIIGIINLLSGSKLSKKQSRYLEILQESANSLLAILNDILDLSKVEAGKITFVNEKFELEKLLKTLKDTYKDKAFEKGLEFRFFIDWRMPKVLIGDPVRLNQILLNLVSNAIKFTNKGSIYVNTRLIRKQKDNVVIQFQVKDTGIGIPNRKFKYLFQDFGQIHDRRRNELKGTGLGLSIVKRLVEAQDGEVSVKSRVNHGSTFSVVLPMKLPSKVSL